MIIFTSQITPTCIADIKFIGSAGGRQEEHDGAQPTTKRNIPEPSESELKLFYEALHQAEKKPAVLKITQPYAAQFISTSILDHYPKPITDLYNPAIEVDYLHLRQECERTFDLISVSYVFVW